MMERIKTILMLFLSLTLVLFFAMPVLANDAEIDAEFEDESTIGLNVWHVPGDFPTIQDAIDSPMVMPSDKIHAGPGSLAGATITKRVNIKCRSGSAMIDTGITVPGLPGEVGFYIPDSFGSGSSISHCRFNTAIEFPIVGVNASYISIDHNKMTNPIQGVTVGFNALEWDIAHNKITDLQTLNGGGIGIYVVGVGSEIVENKIAHNKIKGILHVSAGDVGGYFGAGIAIQAIGPGGAIIENRVKKNKIRLESDDPTTVDLGCIELSEVSGASGVIYDNKIIANKLNCGDNGIILEPPSLDNPVNLIAKNKGDTRGNSPVQIGFLPE